MGYGARIGVATGVHDPLHARALVLIPDGGPGVLLLTADLCLITPGQAAGVRREIAEKTGLSPESVLVSCTHTHSGPETGLGAVMTGRPEPPHVARMLEALAETGVEAHRAAAPAGARWGRAEARIGRNRRLADGPVDPEILILDVWTPSGAPLATLYQYACHGTVLGHDNLEISADWPGAACQRIEEATGAPALFLLGAHADIDPRTRGLMDLAIEGQSRGLGFDAVRVLGGEVAEAVLGVLESSAPPPGEIPVRAVSRAATLPVHLGDLPEEEARTELDARKRELAGWLGVEPDALPGPVELYRTVPARAAGLPPSEAREWIARSRLYVRDRTARRWAEGASRLDVETQLVRIGDAALLGLPVEPTTAVGLDWKRRARKHVPLAGVAGIANGWLRYLPHPDDLADPLAHQRYEILQSLLVPSACERLLALGEELLDEAVRA
jgi:hypothetical protein